MTYKTCKIEPFFRFVIQIYFHWAKHDPKYLNNPIL